MSISPPGDIILDVVNAARSTRQLSPSNNKALTRQIAGRLTGDFTKEVKKAAVAAIDQRKLHRAETRNGTPVSQVAKTGNTGAAGKTGKVYQKLEKLFLQSMVSALMSGQGKQFYGPGIAGDYWKSFLSDAIAGKVADGHGFGVAAALQKTTQHTLNSGTVPGDRKIGAQFEKIFLNHLDSIKELSDAKKAPVLVGASKDA